MSKSCEGLISKCVLLSSSEKVVSISYLIVPERLAVDSLVVLAGLAPTSKSELTSAMSMGYLHSNLIDPPSRKLNFKLLKLLILRSQLILVISSDANQMKVKNKEKIVL